MDDPDRHLAAAGSLDRALKPPAMYLAWCGNLQLLGAAFQEAHATALLRLRYREISPGEFLAATTGGSIDTRDLSQEGRRFTERYYADYLADLERLFGPDVYDMKDDWQSYDRISEPLTRRFMQRSRGERSANGERRRWWQIWR